MMVSVSILLSVQFKVIGKILTAMFTKGSLNPILSFQAMPELNKDKAKLPSSPPLIRKGSPSESKIFKRMFSRKVNGLLRLIYSHFLSASAYCLCIQKTFNISPDSGNTTRE